MNHRMPNWILALALCSALLLSGCWSDRGIVGPEDGLTTAEGLAPASDDATDDTVPITSFSLPYLAGASLDPLTCNDGVQLALTPLLYEGLFELDASFAPQNVLCESYTTSPDYKSWVFTLRSGVTFSNGSPLTAADAAASLRRAQTSARYAARLSEVVSVSASSGAVTVTLSSANNRLPALLDIPVVQERTAADLIPVGTGPYRFSAAEDGTASLVTNDSWWQGKSLPVSSINLKDTDAETLAYLFSSHQIQLVTTDFTGTDPVSYKGAVSVTDTDSTVLHYLGFNCRSGVFADPALRGAVSAGINREYLVKAYLSGHARAAEFPVNPAAQWYPENLARGYSSETFERAMSDADCTRGRSVPVTLLVCSGNSFTQSIASYIAASLSLYDLDVTVKSLPYADYLAALQSGKFDFYYGEVRMTPDFDCSSLVATGGTLNYGGYSSALTDAALATTLSAGSAADSANASLMSALQDDAPIAPICFKCTSVVLQSGAAEEITPTAFNSFYQFSDWHIHIKGESTNG